MAYPVNTDLKTYLAISGSTEDALLTTIVTAARGYIERECNRTFEAASSAKTFPAQYPFVSPDRLRLNTYQDFCSVSAITNGDGVAVTVATEILLHATETPYYRIDLKPSKGKVWYSVDDVPISVTAFWGFALVCPPAIFEAILELGANIYRRRQTGNAGQVLQVGRGLIVQPSDIPDTVGGVINAYRRYSA
jgi:hypothetical protein